MMGSKDLNGESIGYMLKTNSVLPSNHYFFETMGRALTFKLTPCESLFMACILLYPLVGLVIYIIKKSKLAPLITPTHTSYLDGLNELDLQELLNEHAYFQDVYNIELLDPVFVRNSERRLE